MSEYMCSLRLKTKWVDRNRNFSISLPFVNRLMAVPKMRFTQRVLKYV